MSAFTSSLHHPEQVDDADPQTVVLTRNEARQVMAALAASVGWFRADTHDHAKELAVECQAAWCVLEAGTVAHRVQAGQRLDVVCSVGWHPSRLILTDDELDALGMLDLAMSGRRCPGCATEDWNSHTWECGTVAK